MIVSKPHIDVRQAGTADLSLDLEHPTHKVDTIADPEHYVTLEFYFSRDLPTVAGKGGATESWTYPYYFESKGYKPAIWVHIENLEDTEAAYQDLTFGPTPHVIGFVTEETFAQVSHIVFDDHVDITFTKTTSASDDTNFDFTGLTIFVRLYIFEEEAD